MLNKTVTFRADGVWLAMLDRLADEADRNQSEFIRDVIWLLATDKNAFSAVRAEMQILQKYND